jgi:hypothetical protein
MVLVMSEVSDQEVLDSDMTMYMVVSEEDLLEDLIENRDMEDK